MKSLFSQSKVVLALAFAAFAVQACPEAKAVGVLYEDPGWFYAYDGNEAYYNDEDGPHPDYFNGVDDNSPGGQGGTAALVFPGYTNPSCDPETDDCAVDNDDPEWFFKSNQWDGSAPGDALGGVPTGTPPLLPAAPGGVETYTESGTTYLRVQDPGQPTSYGWVDKGAQVGPGTPQWEGNNRKIQFGHDLTVDSSFSGGQAILDNGITISMRARLSTLATGPLDDLFPEGGTTLANTLPWPTDGFGSRIYNDGRGMFHLTQTGAGGEQQMAFSLMDQSVLDSDLEVLTTKTGLVMNNRSNAGAADDVDTNFATETSLNILEIPNDELDEWQEFWITIEALPAPIDGNTHDVNVYHNGEITTPQNFQIVLAGENEFGTGAHLGMGMSSGTAPGAYDIDYYAYKEGIIIPTLAAPDDADFDGNGDIDGADFLAWQGGFGMAGASKADGDANGDTLVDDLDFAIWDSQFGTVGPAVAAATVPEPSSILLMLLGLPLLLARKTR